MITTHNRNENRPQRSPRAQRLAPVERFSVNSVVSVARLFEIVSSLCLLVFAAHSVQVMAQGADAYPAKPVRMIVPLAAGGPSDTVARILAAKMTEGMGQNVIVDNRPGASGIIGTELVARSPADGYTILLVSSTIAINPAIMKKLP